MCPVSIEWFGRFPGGDTVRAVIQRVSQASVTVNAEIVGRIGAGLVALIGVGLHDSEADARWLAEKIAGLRVFDDPEGKMNLSVLDVRGQILAVSQFTLYGDCRRGRRPGFSDAAPAAVGERLYNLVVECLSAHGLTVATGVYQARMRVELINDGPVTLLLDSERRF